MRGANGDTPGGDERSSARRLAEQATFAAGAGVDGDRAVLRLAGEFDLSNIEAAQAWLSAAVEQSPSGRVVIDMTELEFIDSTGIAFLVRAVQEHGRNLSIRESEALEVRRVLGLVGIPDFALGEDASIEPHL